MTSLGRASGKIILLGEHAVVYGCPAIAAGIALGATATAEPADKARIALEPAPTAEQQQEVDRAFAALLSRLDSPPMTVRARTDVPPGLGLGASAALAVAVARAVVAAVTRSAAPQPITSAAQAWESVFHGRPSGIDVAAATLGGCFRFSLESGPKPLQIPKPLHLAIGVAGPPMSTKVMVTGLAQLRQQKPDLVGRSIQGIHALVDNAQLALEAGDLSALGRLLDLNQMLLAGLFLSSEGIERACAIARDAGALGAKLTGKGGGGCVIALCDGDQRPILDAWRKNGIDGFATVIANQS